LPAGPSQPQPLYSMASWSIPALIPRDSPREPPSASRAPRSARPARTFSSLSLTLARRAPSPLSLSHSRPARTFSSLSLDRCAPYPLSLSLDRRAPSPLSPARAAAARCAPSPAARGGEGGQGAGQHSNGHLFCSTRRGGVAVASLRVAAWWHRYGWRRGGVTMGGGVVASLLRRRASLLRHVQGPPRVWL
jgi:hypothetical protein